MVIYCYHSAKYEAEKKNYYYTYRVENASLKYLI